MKNVVIPNIISDIQAYKRIGSIGIVTLDEFEFDRPK